MTPAIITAHPASHFHNETAALLSELAGTRAFCLNPTLGRTFEEMVDDIESQRIKQNLGRCLFYGMSGGGWLAQLYAHRHPEALCGVIIESACACFRARLADPSCLISPHHPMWREKLEQAGLLEQTSHNVTRGVHETEWTVVEGIGEVFRAKNGPALLISPGPQTDELRAAMPVLYTFDSRAFINTLALPALVIAGSEDPIVPVSHVRAVHEAIAGSKFLEVKGAGHVPTGTKSPEVAKAVRAMIAQL